MAYNPPTLYAKSSTGKSMQWSIEVEETMGGGLIRTRHGYEGGKIQVNEKTITVGKNLKSAITTEESGNMIRGKAVFRINLCPEVTDFTPELKLFDTK